MHKAGSLKFKSALVCVLAAILMSLALSGAALAGEIRLRFANFPAAGTFPCVSMERWAEEIAKRTNGRVKVETFAGGTLLDAKNMLRGVTRGQADIGCISLAYHPGAFPFLSVFELPLGFSSAKDASGVMWDVHAAHQPAETSKYKVIALFSSAPSQIMSAKPVENAASVKGLKLRSAGILADVAEAIGASPVSMPQSDTPEALQKGMVQGVFSSFDVLKDYNFAESCRYGLKIDMPVYPFMFFMNMKTWESLPGDVRDAIMDLAREHSVWTGEYVDGHGLEALQWADENYGFKLTELDAAGKEALMRMAAPVIEEWVKRSEGKKVKARELLAEVLAARDALRK